MADTVHMVGGCTCGQLRYTVTRAPLFAYICHCHRCQKRTGSAFSMSMVIPEDGFAFTQGNPMRSERPLSDGGTTLSFLCGTCHSRIYTRTAGRKTINVRVGTLDETHAIRPIAQFWTSSAQPWALVTSDILSYAEQPTDYTPLVRAWAEAAPGA